MRRAPGLAMVEPDRKGAELLTALRARDPAVARPLWQRFAPTVHRILRHTLGPQAEIDDAAQVVLLCVFERAARLRPRSDLRRFVVGITARIAQVELRRRKLSWVFAASRFRAGRKPARPGVARPVPEAVARFYRILDRLSALDRVTFVLYYFEGLDVREIATAMEAAPGATSRRLRRAVGKVARSIGGDPALK
jgi:RNA polymerase sigma factor (sigma-70 family)